MKFKESLNWKRYPAKFKEENGIDFIGTFLSTNRHDIEKIKINVFKDGDREKEYNCKIYTFNYYVDALNFLAERDLLDIDYLDNFTFDEVLKLYAFNEINKKLEDIIPAE